ncbi:MAG: YcxB family protein [Ruminococcaceae bacterium]|nr:YcxB family protein [Oscillospiraceae bacterium]
MKVKVTNRPEYASEVVDSLLLRRNVIVFILMGLMAFLGIWNVVGGATRSDMGDIGVGALYLFFDLLLGGVLLFARYKQTKGFAEAIRFTCTGSPQQEVLFAEQIVAERYGEDGELIGKTVTDYQTLRRAWETKNLILLYSRSNAVLILPKCDLSAEEQAGVKQILASKGVSCKFKKS